MTSTVSFFGISTLLSCHETIIFSLPSYFYSIPIIKKTPKLKLYFQYISNLKPIVTGTIPIQFSFNWLLPRNQVFHYPSRLLNTNYFKKRQLTQSLVSLIKTLPLLQKSAQLLRNIIKFHCKTNSVLLPQTKIFDKGSLLL
jgi:hypothetical protein